jgi:hypothetical protein
MAVVGFLEYQDFHNEIKQHGSIEWPVRVQYYNEAIRSSEYPLLKQITFFVMAACETNRDVLVCRFRVGQDDHEGRLEQLRQKALETEQRLIKNLQTISWLQVRKGLIAASTESKTEAAGLGNDLDRNNGNADSGL